MRDQLAGDGSSEAFGRRSLRVCLASIHPRMLSGQIEGLVALRSRLEELGHSVQLVSAFPSERLRAGRRWAADSGDGLALAPKIVRIGGIVGAIAQTARDCDVLHFNVPTPAFGILADAVQMLIRRPMVVGFEAHLVDVPAVASRLPRAPGFYAPRLIVNNGLAARLTMRRGQRYVVSSQYQRHELLALGYDGTRIHVIPNLIDDAKLRRWDKEEARHALGLPPFSAAKLVAFVGHFHDVKGHDVLLEAFRYVRARAPDTRLVLAWSGIGDRAKVGSAIAREELADDVIELGRLDVGQLFSAADVVALPYRFSIGQAAFPGTVLEAMRVGVPLVTTNLPLLEELSDGGRTALLARPDDPAHLAEHIVRLLVDPALGAELVRAQQAAMAGRFDSGKLIPRYVDAYRQALASHRRVAVSPELAAGR